MPRQKRQQRAVERELDKEAAQEFEEFVEYERAHRDQDEQSYDEIADEDFNRDAVEDDPDEFRQD